VSAGMPSQIIDHAGRRARINASLEYGAVDPSAVTLTIHQGGARKTRRFGRELLTQGLHRPVGERDVVVAPVPNAAQGAVLLGFRNGAADAVIEISGRSLSRFLSRTYGSVPSRGEDDYLDIDRLTLQLRCPAAGGDVINAEA
jgi:hypothetical protein